MTTTFVRPEPGVRWTLYRYATFPPCPMHLLADALVVLVVTEEDAWTDPPVCAECGAPLFREELRRDDVRVQR